jgi:hypothetical protein
MRLVLLWSPPVHTLCTTLSDAFSRSLLSFTHSRRHLVPMPPGTPYASFALPYPIRVDCFTCTAHLPTPYRTPALYLLTHSHTDHIVGLSSKSFAAQVVCSPDTKEMLLRHEIHLERAKKDAGEVATRTFAHLKVEGGAISRDLLVSARAFFTLVSLRDTLT